MSARGWSRLLAWAWCLIVGIAAGTARAEPYLAVDQGYKCIVCHVNPSGGGLRNAFGLHFARSTLAAHSLPERLPTWSGSVGDVLRLGGDARWDSMRAVLPEQPGQRSAGWEQARVYADVSIAGERLGLYVDEQFAPGKATRQEGYLRLNGEARAWSLKAGQFYLPFGWRLQDNTTFVRAVSGIGMSTPQRGLEIGIEHGDWSSQLALTRPPQHEPGADRQATAQLVWVQAWGRLGGALASSRSSTGSRQAWALFGGWRTGPMVWLGELDLVRDSGYPEGQRRLLAALGELNWKLAQGHNLKVGAEYFDPDRHVAEDHKVRRSLVYEYTPLPFVQLRLGRRDYRGIPQNRYDNRGTRFVELHVFM